MNSTLKRLKEIEARVAPQGDPAWVEAELVDARWLCARLRDALAYIEAVNRFPGSDPDKGRAAYRRLFGEEESRG